MVMTKIGVIRVFNHLGHFEKDVRLVEKMLKALNVASLRVRVLHPHLCAIKNAVEIDYRFSGGFFHNLITSYRIHRVLKHATKKGLNVRRIYEIRV